MTKQTISVQLSTTKKQKPQTDQLEFGRIFTDHMFIMDYSVERGWHDPKIVPYQPIEMDPAAMVYHYGQSVFEGLKAYLSKEGKVLLFRPGKNIERLNQSNNRLCIPQVDPDTVLEGLKTLIQIDKEWIPTTEGTSLYIRPFIISTEPFLGVAPSKMYKLLIILSPVGSYYKEGIHPVKIAVESEFVRAVAGGTGTAKTAGNYAASLKAQEVAENLGFSQVLWLDGVERKYIEEVGSMNIFFKINGEIVTPALNGSILEGITRNSVIYLLRQWGYSVIEKKISIEELFEAYKAGQLEEAFGTGTAAVISPIGELMWKEHHLVINNGQTGKIAKQLYETITGIQKGAIQDSFDWTVEVDSISL
ncbi:branched-chain amino acid aminotransferase [Bacillus changyiensis]|uniref:branched-chain amino acid aminotransferase n=1 Tax=Bacillus changyiensis TaxID=3004103 RepID=UPI0022E6ADF1|nr:branched-chain amino acid aminotransferase [Bacillus changyiensis]MDA1476811.1 branched-chain amino acid aminotransferase [Bacillus changyiensis]